MFLRILQRCYNISDSRHYYALAAEDGGTSEPKDEKDKIGNNRNQHAWDR